MRGREIVFLIKLRNQAKRALSALGGDFKKAAVNAQAADKATRKLNKDLGVTAAAGKRAGAAIASGMKRATAATVSFGTILRSVTSLLAVLGIGLGIGAAVGELRDFGQQMSTVQAVTGATTEQMVQLNDVARQLGATTRFTGTQAAEGLEFLARAGFTAQEAVQALPGTLALAQAGALDLGRAADITSNIMSAFGIEAERTGGVADVLAFITTKTNTNVEQLGEGMKLAAPIASSLGISLNETASAMGVLGNSGLQASIAGTGLRAIMNDLVNPTNTTKDALREMGLALDDVNPATTSLTEIFGKFRTAGLDASQAFKLFGQRGAASSLILTKAVDTLADLEEGTINSAGAAQRMADIMDDNLNGDILKLVSSVSEAIQALGESGLTGVLRTVTQTITGVINVWSGILDVQDEANRQFVFLAETIKILGVALGTAGLILILAKVTTAIRTLSIALAVNPFGLLVIAISGAAAALFVFRQDLDKLVTSVKDGINSIARNFLIGLDIITLVADKIADKVKGLGGIITGALTLDREAITASYQAMTKDIEITLDELGAIIKARSETDLVAGIADGITAGAGKVSEAVKAAVDAASEALVGTAREIDLAEALGNPGAQAASLGRAAGEEFGNNFDTGAREAAAAAVEQKGPILDVLKGVDQGIDAFKESAADLTGSIASATETSLNGMSRQLADFATTGAADFKGMAQSILGDLSQIAIKFTLLQGLNTFASGASNFGFSGFAGLLGGGVTAPVIHKGGRVGATSAARQVPADTFKRARRYHSGGEVGGIRAGEVPAILQKGEQVLSRQQVANGGGRGDGPINVSIVVNTPDADSFRQSEGEIAASMGAAINRQVGRNR